METLPLYRASAGGLPRLQAPNAGSFLHTSTLLHRVELALGSYFQHGLDWEASDISWSWLHPADLAQAPIFGDK